jgi:hypothetical protein
VSSLREAMQRIVDDPPSATSIERILDQTQRTLSIRMASLDRARCHARFIEHKLAMGGKVFETLPYVESRSGLLEFGEENAGRQGSLVGSDPRRRLLHQGSCSEKSIPRLNRQPFGRYRISLARAVESASGL